MRLRSRQRERSLAGKRSSGKIGKPPKSSHLNKSSNSWTKVITSKKPSKVTKNEVTTSYELITNKKALKTRPVRTKTRSMEKTVPTHKSKVKLNDKKPIFQTVVRSSTITSTTVKKDRPKPAQNDKVSTTTDKPKPDQSIRILRHNSLNRELRCRSEVMSSDRISSPRKIRRVKMEKAASLNSSPIRKVRQISIAKANNPVTSTIETKSRKKAKPPIVPTPEHSTNEWTAIDDNDVTMYEAHTTTFVDITSYPTPKTSEESDSDVPIETTGLCLSNDCLNEFISITHLIADEQLSNEDDDINFLADKAARVMTANDQETGSRKNSVDKHLGKRRMSSNDLEMYQPSSTTDDLDVCADFLNAEKYVQVCYFIQSLH